MPFEIIENTPGGAIAVELDGEKTGLNMVSRRSDQLPSFEAALEAMKANAEHVLETVRRLQPDEVEICFGLKAGAEAGSTFWGLAKASGEASYTVKLVWKRGDAPAHEESGLGGSQAVARR